MTSEDDISADELSRYTIHSRREIVALLRNVSERNQLVHMQADSSGDSIVTSILHVDDAGGTVIIDCAQDRLINARLLESDHVSFETLLDNVRMLFSVASIEHCDHEARPALRIALPATLIRLQRRESYRVQTPVASPVNCVIPLFNETNQVTTWITAAIANIGAGGLRLVDDKKAIAASLGQNFEDCTIELPDGPVTITLQLRDMQDAILRNGRHVRRLGFMFVEPSVSAVTLVQRYIMKIEREQNARKAGLG
jgi:c-di-GMP-binding flagellar brake protein YcgR